MTVEQKAYGKELLEDLQEQSKEQAKESRSGFSGGMPHVFEGFWELKHFLSHMEDIQENYCLRINHEKNDGEGQSGFRINNITAQGNWRIYEDWGRHLKIMPNGTVANIDINTWIYEYWTVMVDSMGWIDVFIADGEMNKKDDVGFIHLVFMPNK